VSVVVTRFEVFDGIDAIYLKEQKLGSRKTKQKHQRSNSNMTTMITTMNISDQESKQDQGKKKTLGEELFLVHLSRCQKDDESLDYDTPRPRSLSTSSAVSRGEELWNVHCKRMEGWEEAEEEVEAPPTQKKAKKSTQEDVNHGRTIHLRSRDVSV
jgi:hypothetical protein